jgi:hypothetical protein
MCTVLYNLRKIRDWLSENPLRFYKSVTQKKSSWWNLQLTKQAVVPLSFLHWASRVSNFPGRTRGRDSSSWGELYRQLAVSPLKRDKQRVGLRFPQLGHDTAQSGENRAPTWRKMLPESQLTFSARHGVMYGINVSLTLKLLSNSFQYVRCKCHAWTTKSTNSVM